MEDRLMTVRELAAYLKVNQRTVLKLATQGPLPAVRVGSQWRFRKVMIDAWLDDQMLGLRRRYVELPRAGDAAPLLLELENCFGVGQIVPELTATTKTAAIEELAGHTASLGLVRDKHWFIGALIERENVMPTAVGNGVAFLHTLRRHPEQVTRPFMVLGRSAAGVDFAALDGLPTRLFFVLGLRYQELHLPWLTKLVQMLAGGRAKEQLLAAPDADGMYEVLVAAERKLHESAHPATSA
jgi:excisionase family DNA binding protein